MKRIKKIKTLSFAKMLAAVSGIFYLMTVLLIMIVGSLFFDSSPLQEFDFLGFSSTVVATILFSLIVAGVNFVIGLIIAWIYNLTVPLIGGIKVELMEEENIGSMFETKEKTIVSAKPTAQAEVNEAMNDSFLTEEKRDTFSTEDES